MRANERVRHAVPDRSGATLRPGPDSVADPELAEYEQLSHEVMATEALLREALFGDSPVAHAVIARAGESPAGFALYFYSFSTFLALAPACTWRISSFGRNGASADLGRSCSRISPPSPSPVAVVRMEWSVLNWNDLAQRVYRAVGAQPMSDWTVQRLSGTALANLAATVGRRDA